MSDKKIATPRLTFRDYLPQDWERVHSYGSDPLFSQFEPWGPNSVDDTKKFVNKMVRQAEDPERYQFDYAVCTKAGLLIGGCGIRLEGPTSQIAKLGWAIHPEFQKKGYATEAARALLRFGFEGLETAIVFAACDARNIASARVMEKVGMTCVGLLRDHTMQKGQMRDTLRYEMTRAGFQSLK